MEKKDRNGCLSEVSLKSGFLSEQKEIGLFDVLDYCGRIVIIKVKQDLANSCGLVRLGH